MMIVFYSLFLRFVREGVFFGPNSNQYSNWSSKLVEPRVSRSTACY